MLERLFIIWQYLSPHHLFSRVVGRLANCRIEWLKNFLIKLAMRHFAIRLEEAELSNIADYPSFNAFFTRALLPKARPISQQENAIISPADGIISALGELRQDQLLQAKGRYYSLKALLANDSMAQAFQNGSFATIYLAPKDYHRVHIPCNGKLMRMIYIPGRLFSVNPTTVNHVPELFTRNERVVVEFSTEYGPMAVIFVGALLVASIKTTWAGIVAPSRPHQIKTIDYEQQNLQYAKGDEIGQFQFGSTVIVLFAKAKIQWDEELKAGSELKMGVNIGSNLRLI